MRPPNNFGNNSGKGARQGSAHEFVARAFSGIVALWPADSRDWALAMQAELGEIESTQGSLRWLAGGIMSLGKAWWNGAFSGDSKKEHAPVKKPGLLAALTAVAALALLLIPSAHQGLRAVLWSWQPNREATEQAQYMQMAREAESQGDAKTMAFAAMRLGSWKDLVSYSNKAVALDPSLTWIFSQGFFGDVYVPESRDWPAKLEAWDPGNGVAFIIQAEIRVAELSHAANSSLRGPKQDSQWLEAGRKAMESPRYDSYHDRRLQLDREIIRARGMKDPDVIVGSSLRSGWINLWLVQVYSKALLDEAKAAVERGDQQTATRDAWAVAHFGELLRAHGGTEIERLSSVEYLRPAYTILQPLVAAEGRSDEAKMLSQELEAMEPGDWATQYSYWLYTNYGWWRTASIGMHLGAAGSVLLAMALLFAGVWLFAARFAPNMGSGALYRMACRSGRYAPAGLLVSLAVLAGSYSPTAESVSNYLEKPISNVTMRNLSETYESIYYFPDLVRSSLRYPSHTTFWMIVMVFGVLTIAMIIARNILNRKMRPRVA
jgi:hypothetical protein